MRKIIGIWLVLLFIFLPIDYRLIPDFGTWLSRILLPINDFLASILFDESVSNTFDKSDSLAFYTGAVILFIFASVSSLFIQREIIKLHLINYTLIGFLSYYLIRYGFDKIIGIQFYEASPNILHTKLGNISKDLLFWNTMGASQFYNWFMALSEIIAGVLILFNRTRFIGLLFAFGILLNVFSINIGYDITVKFLSGLLLFSCIYLLTFYRQRILLLIGDKQRINENEIVYSPKSKLKKVIVIGFIIFLLFENFAPLFNSSTNFQLAGKSFEVENNHQLQLIHFHPDGYFIIQNGEDFISNQALITSSQILTKELTYHYRLSNDSLYLTLGNSEYIGKEIPNNKMALLQDEAHVFLEQILP